MMPVGSARANPGRGRGGLGPHTGGASDSDSKPPSQIEASTARPRRGAANASGNCHRDSPRRAHGVTQRLGVPAQAGPASPLLRRDSDSQISPSLRLSARRPLPAAKRTDGAGPRAQGPAATVGPSRPG